MIATAESTIGGAAAKLPPRVRDFEIYRFVKFQCNSTREAAHAFRISQTRVRQVIAHVVEFMIESVPAGTDQEPSDQRLYVAEQLAYERLEYLYQRAIKGFDATHHEDVHGNLLPGKVNYLAVAGRITLWMSKVPVHPLPRFRDEEDESEAEKIRVDRSKFAAAAPRVEDENENEHENDRDTAGDQTPPVAECSLRAVSRGDSSPVADVPRDVSVPAEGTYRSLDEIKAAARRNFLRPAQTTLKESIESPASGTSEPPAADPLHARTPLNRRERRARERRRKRLMGKR